MKIIEKTYSWKSGLSTRVKINEIILHHADAKECSADDIHSWHIQRGWSGFGYHFFVRKDGKIYRGRPENTVGAHASGHNLNTIGVCFEGDFENEYMTDIQIKAGQELVKYLKDKYNISIVKGHRDYMATDCPGKNFPFDEIVNGKIKENIKNDKNLILEFQLAAQKDGFEFPKYGADGYYGKETEDVMKICVVKRRETFKNRNTTKLVQQLLGIDDDGLCGKNTENAIRAFQSKHGLISDGCVGLNTWKVLLNIK